MRSWIACLALLLLFTACHPATLRDAYHQQYTYLPQRRALVASEPRRMQTPPYFLAIMVDAPHLDYSHTDYLIATIAKHPERLSRRRDVGHAWIVLGGTVAGVPNVIEVGHSGELGRDEPRILDEVVRRAQLKEADAISYAFEDLHDGFLQHGAGGHSPTFALLIPITSLEWRVICDFIHSGYDYSRYNLRDRQCTTFVAHIAALAGLRLDVEVTVPITQYLTVDGTQLKLWSNPDFSAITIASPDKLEKSLVMAAFEGKGVPALRWYREIGYRLQVGFQLK